MANSTASEKPHSFNPTTVPAPPPTYNQAAVTAILSSSNLIKLAGQVGDDLASGKVVSHDIKEQAQLAYQNVLNCLIAAGATPRDIVHVRHYIVKTTGDANVDKLDVVDRGWAPFWMEFLDREPDGYRPPDAVLGVASLAKKDLLYEVEVEALIHG